MTRPSVDPAPRKRLLFICGFIPDRDGTGLEKRIFSFLSAYSQAFEIDLWFSQNPGRDANGLPELTRSICTQRTDFSDRNIFDLKDPIAKTFQNALKRADAVHVSKLTHIVRHIRNIPIYWDVDELPKPYRNRSTFLDWLLRRGGDKRAFLALARQVDRCFVSSEIERGLIGPATHVIPNSLVIQADEANSIPPPDHPVILFVGALGHFPNLFGMERFCHEVFPHIRAALPQVELCLVGRLPAKPELRQRVEHLAQTPGLTCHFNVPRVGAYYARATIVIAPIYSGGGTRMKIIEAFGHKRPVISTAKGCEGLAVSDGQELLIAESANELAAACIRALTDPALRAALAGAAHLYYLGNHTPEIITEKIMAAVDR